MTLEAALFSPTLLKPVFDALLLRFRQRRQRELRRGGEAALRDAIRELLLPHPDEHRVESKLAQARSAGTLSRDMALAETMLHRHRETRARTAGKAHRSRRRKVAASATAENGAERVI